MSLFSSADNQAAVPASVRRQLIPASEVVAIGKVGQAGIANQSYEVDSYDNY